MNPVEAPGLPDIQNRPDDREVAIEAVGVASLRYPVLVVDRDATVQRTIATVEMDVDLPAHLKGTHMSRFVETLDARADDLSAANLVDVAAIVRETLDSQRARVALQFPYFLERTAPISGLRSISDFEGRLAGEVDGGHSSLEVGVRVAVASLCPCSKEISDYGAHNQRGYIDLDVRCSSDRPVWLQDLIEVAEGCGSAPLYTLLKRVDERHVTMEAYDNPAFVEDIARDAAVALRSDARVAAFTVRVANQESIHNHEAVARVRWERAS
jgi:GTP cyclohydrolase FolE2